MTPLLPSPRSPPQPATNDEGQALRRAVPGDGGAGSAQDPWPRGYGPAFRALTAACLASAYLLVVLGDTVRVTESGMGCRSWPLCNGQAGLAGTYHALLEQSHRYLAAAANMLAAARGLLSRYQV